MVDASHEPGASPARTAGRWALAAVLAAYFILVVGALWPTGARRAWRAREAT